MLSPRIEMKDRLHTRVRLLELATKTKSTIGVNSNQVVCIVQQIRVVVEGRQTGSALASTPKFHNLMASSIHLIAVLVL